MGDDGQRAPLPEPWRRRLYLPAYRIAAASMKLHRDLGVTPSATRRH